MHPSLKTDENRLYKLMKMTLKEGWRYLEGLRERTPNKTIDIHFPEPLPEEARGAETALRLFQERYSKYITGSPGPRYFGFVTGGTTPAALMGDWLTTCYDQLPAGDVVNKLERECLDMMGSLFNLPKELKGTFVTGATMAEFVGLATGRQWLAKQSGINIAREGLYNMPPINVLSASPHSSIYKAMSMLGMGSDHLIHVDSLSGREAIDVVRLERILQELQGQPVIVVGTAGTVQTGDFDDMKALAKLKEKYNFWWHIDGAFGGYAACSDNFNHLIEGWESADSIALDGHKWLNVPYESGVAFVRHRQLQSTVFHQLHASYIGDNLLGEEDFVNLTPECSRRWKGLPAWFTLMAYGREGYKEIIDRNCKLAKTLGDWIEGSERMELLAPVKLNIVCFSIKGQNNIAEVNDFLHKLNRTGKTFMTSTLYKGKPAIRAAICNWQTTSDDIEQAWKGIDSILKVGTPEEELFLESI